MSGMGEDPPGNRSRGHFVILGVCADSSPDLMNNLHVMTPSPPVCLKEAFQPWDEMSVPGLLCLFPFQSFSKPRPAHSVTCRPLNSGCLSCLHSPLHPGRGKKVKAGSTRTRGNLILFGFCWSHPGKLASLPLSSKKCFMALTA